MVSDIYFPVLPSPYPAFYPISPPISYYPHSPQRTIRSPQNMPSSNYNTTNSKRHDQVYDSNRNHVVPYYYSETLTPCMPNNRSVPNTYLSNRNRHTFASYPHDERQKHYQRLKSSRMNNAVNMSPEVSYGHPKSNVLQPQPFRPYSVLESAIPPTPNPRPSSVTITEQFRPASVFFQEEPIRATEVPEWKARLQRDPSTPVKGLVKPLKPICRIPNCNCGEAIPLSKTRFSESRTLPTISPRLHRQKNLSLPTLKLEELERDEKTDNAEAERDVPSAMTKPISEQNLGYV